MNYTVFSLIHNEWLISVFLVKLSLLDIDWKNTVEIITDILLNFICTIRQNIFPFILEV